MLTQAKVNKYLLPSPSNINNPYTSLTPPLHLLHDSYILNPPHYSLDQPISYPLTLILLMTSVTSPLVLNKHNPCAPFWVHFDPPSTSHHLNILTIHFSNPWPINWTISLHKNYPPSMQSYNAILRAWKIPKYHYNTKITPWLHCWNLASFTPSIHLKLEPYLWAYIS